MKLSELRNKFRNKYAIRIVAGVLVVALAGAPVSMVKAAPGNDGQATESSTEESAGTETDGEDSDQEDAEKLLDEVIGSSVSVKEKETGKEETVYVITDSAGKEKEVIVLSHLINSDGKDTIKDTSTLEGIENVKGEETYTKDGDGITWQAGGNDIFYRGTSKEQVPVSQKITYYLDGKEIAAKELAGKSGKVKIRFEYTNNQKVTAEIGGKETEICVPFVAVSGLVLDEKFSNIKVENGKVMADGNNSMVLGYTMPGLKESLDVKESDFDGEISFPEYFEVTADVEDFSLGATMTVVMNAADFVSREGDGSTSSLDEILDTLTDAADQLKDGSAELADGTGTLKSKMGEFSDGVGTLSSGIKDYTEGASTLAEGIGTLQGGVQSLTDNVPALTSGVGQLKEGSASAAQGASALKEGTGSLKAGAGELSKGATELSAGANDLSTGAGTLSAGANDLSAGAGTLSAGADDLLTGANSLAEGVQSLAQGTKGALAGANSVSAGASALNDGVGTLVGKIQGVGGTLEQTKNGLFAQAGVSTYEEMEAMVGQLKAAQEQCINGIAGAAASGASDQVAQLSGQLAGINDNIEKLQSAMGAITAIGQVQQELANPEVAAQLTALQTGASDLAAGAANLASGLGTISEGADGAAAGAASLATGAGNLAAGAKEVAAGAGSLAAGAGDLATGAGTLAAGAGKVSSGAKQVLDGSTQVDDGAASLASGLGTLDAGLGTLNEKAGALGSGAAALKDGTDRLASGAAQLVANNAKLNDGAHKLSDGTAALTDGIGALDDGAHKLADGIVEFNEEGIEKILDAFNGDIEPLIDRMQAVLDAGNDYQSYAGLADGVNGSVKFIYKTDAVKAD